MDQHAFERAYEQHRDEIFRYCAFRTNSYSDAEDITADVFVALMQSRRPPQDHYLLPWLYRVAQRRCVSRHRQARRVHLTPDAIGDSELVEEPWSEHDVWLRVAQLPANQQLIVYLRVLEDRPFDEIARLTGRRLSAIKMSFYRAMEALRRDLSAEGEH